MRVSFKPQQFKMSIIEVGIYRMYAGDERFDTIDLDARQPVFWDMPARHPMFNCAGEIRMPK